MTMARLKTIACGATLLVSAAFTPARAQINVTPAEARAIAKEAYIYGFPIVDNYRIQYGYFVDRQNSEFKAPWNQIRNIPRVYTPADTAIQTPNSDTPYSFVGMDLRAGCPTHSRLLRMSGCRRPFSSPVGSYRVPHRSRVHYWGRELS